MRWFRRRNEADELEPAPFDPEPINVEGLRERVLDHIGRLLPYGVDEATPYVLDEWIDKNIEVEVARRVRAWARYRDRLMPSLVEARADQAYEEIMNDADQRDLAEYRFARDTAVLELLGLAELPPDLRPRRDLSARAQDELSEKPLE